jgi:hypothetical protein
MTFAIIRKVRLPTHGGMRAAGRVAGRGPHAAVCGAGRCNGSGALAACRVTGIAFWAFLRRDSTGLHAVCLLDGPAHGRHLDLSAVGASPSLPQALHCCVVAKLLRGAPLRSTSMSRRRSGASLSSGHFSVARTPPTDFSVARTSQVCPVNTTVPNNGCTPQAEDDEGISTNGNSEGFQAPPYAACPLQPRARGVVPKFIFSCSSPNRPARAFAASDIMDLTKKISPPFALACPCAGVPDVGLSRLLAFRSSATGAGGPRVPFY